MAKELNIKHLKTHKHIDEDLLHACSKQDAKALEILYEACYQFLIPMCMRYYKNPDDARSAYNLGFMKIIKHIDDVKKDASSFISWSRKVMTNTLIDEYRKNKRYSDKITSREHERELDFHSESCQNQADESIGYQFLMRQLDKLKPATKQVFVLYVIEGYNHREISELLNMSEGTSKWHLSTARKELQYFIEKQHDFINWNREAI